LNFGILTEDLFIYLYNQKIIYIYIFHLYSTNSY